MLTALIATWILTPIAPLNPIEQDTLPSISFHIAAGVTVPNGVVSTGSEIFGNYEMRVIHPFVIRLGVSLQHKNMTSKIFPSGNINTIDLSVGGLYYRGSKMLVGYFGASAIYGINFFSPTSQTLDSLNINEGVTDMSMGRKLGFGITLGLRIKKVYSFEINITEMYPSLRKKMQSSSLVFSTSGESVRTGTFRLTFGYVWAIIS